MPCFMEVSSQVICGMNEKTEVLNWENRKLSLVPLQVAATPKDQFFIYFRIPWKKWSPANNPESELSTFPVSNRHPRLLFFPRKVNTQATEQNLLHLTQNTKYINKYIIFTYVQQLLLCAKWFTYATFILEKNPAKTKQKEKRLPYFTQDLRLAALPKSHLVAVLHPIWATS